MPTGTLIRTLPITTLRKPLICDFAHYAPVPTPADATHKHLHKHKQLHLTPERALRVQSPRLNRSAHVTVTLLAGAKS